MLYARDAVPGCCSAMFRDWPKGADFRKQVCLAAVSLSCLVLRASTRRRSFGLGFIVSMHLLSKDLGLLTQAFFFSP